MNVVIRDAQVGDAAEIAAIYNREVLEGVATFDLEERSLEQQRLWITQRSGGFSAIVACLEDGTIVGFGALSPFKERSGYRTTVENSVYVSHNHQGLGIGKALLGALIQRAKAFGFHSIIARIVGANGASVHLHTKLGYSLVGIEREVGRKFGRFYDVTELQIILS